jgi:rubrerythrin
MVGSTGKEDLIHSLRQSAHEEQQAIAKYGRRAAYAAKHNIGLMRIYKRIIRDEMGHYRELQAQIAKVKKLR